MSKKIKQNEFEREYFPFFKSFAKALDGLGDDKTELALYRAITHYGLYGEEPELTGIAAVLWELVLPNLRNSRKQFENGKKGGAPKGSRNNPNGRGGSETTNPELTQIQPKINPELSNKNKNKKKELSNESKKSASRFSPPPIDEVKSYVQEKGYAVDAEQFVNFYESKDWMVGKNKMSNWHAAIATWQKRENDGRDGNFQRRADGRRGSLEVTATGAEDYKTTF